MKLATPILSLGVLLIGAAAVEGLVRSGRIAETIVARPSAVLGAYPIMAHDGDVFGPFAVTLAQTAAATLAAATIGVPIGYLLARYPVLGAAYEGWFGAAFAAPLILLYPLFLVLFGRGYPTVIAMGTLTAIIPIVIKTIEGMRSVPTVLQNVGRSFSLSRQQVVRLIELPAAAPTIFVGLRLGLIYALVNIIGIEFLIDFGGLGRIIADYYARFDIPQMYAGIVLIVVISLGYIAVLDRVQRWIRPA